MTSPTAPDAKYQWTSHHNALGDWCAWSHVAVSANRATADDPHCPAGCPASDVETVSDDGRS